MWSTKARQLSETSVSRFGFRATGGPLFAELALVLLADILLWKLLDVQLRKTAYGKHTSVLGLLELRFS
jgi:hypothetical protein